MIPFLMVICFLTSPKTLQLPSSLVCLEVIAVIFFVVYSVLTKTLYFTLILVYNRLTF